MANMYSLPEAAVTFKINYASLLNYVKKGYINAVDIGKGSRPFYQVSENDMYEFLNGFDKTKKRYRVGKKIEVKTEPETTVNPVIKPYAISDLTRKQIKAKDEEIARIKGEIRNINAKLMDLLIELDTLAQ